MEIMGVPYIYYIVVGRKCKLEGSKKGEGEAVLPPNNFPQNEGRENTNFLS